MSLSVQETRYYKVAGHVFSLTACAGLGDDFFAKNAENYEPFAVCASDCAFSMEVVVNEKVPGFVEETRQDEEGQKIICGITQNGESVFEFYLFEKYVGTLVCAKDYRTSKLFVTDSKNTSYLKFAVNNALMVLYAIATASYDTALFHAAVVRYQERGYMFLGKSGTGKSTHAGLWLKYNEGSTLLNDDNPVVRFYKDADGKGFAKVFGSPWSGKTPCYKNEECVLGGFVLLAQAPYNEISRLRGVQAYAWPLTLNAGHHFFRII